MRIPAHVRKPLEDHMLPTRKKPQDYEFTFEQQRRAKRIAQFMGWGVVACIAVLVIYNIGLAAGRAIR